jgi:class 3 adenylate cyclase/streptogramin lyase
VAELPHGTVTLLFTDVEGSTQLQHRLGERYQTVVAEHRRLLEQAFAAHSGTVVDRQTESFFVAFPRARYAVQAAADAQTALAEQTWPDGVKVKVRMGIHSGDPEVDGDRYVGLAVSRAARICAAAHGGQVLLSSSTRALLSDHDRTALRGLGVHRLKDFEQPEPISQLVVDGLPSQFPPLKTKIGWSRRTKVLLSTGCILLAAAIAGSVVALTGGSSGSVEVGPTSLAVIDPKSNTVVDAVDLGFRSNLIAAGEGYVWVLDPDGSTIRRVDPHSREVKVIAIPAGVGVKPFGIAAGYGSVWVATLRGAQELVLELGPEIGELRRTIPYGEHDPSPLLFYLQPLAVGAGAVWAIDPVGGAVWRIPPRNGAARRLASGLNPRSLAAGAGAVWVADPLGVTKLDATTGIKLGSGSVGSQTYGESASVALDRNALWYAASARPSLAKVDLQSIAPTATFPVGRGPTGIAVGEGAVWVASSGDGGVTRVDPRGGSTRRIAVGPSTGGVVAAYGAVWATPGNRRS